LDEDEQPETGQDEARLAPRPRVSRLELSGVLALFVAGAFLRFYRLDHLSCWTDELATAVYAQWPVEKIVTYQRPVMLQYLILHWVLPLVGQTDWALRLPTAICGTLSVPVMYVFARRHLDRAVAILATSLLVANYAHAVQSQNARYYAFMALMTLLSVLLLFELMQQFRWWLLPLFVVVHALNLLNHLVAIFLLGAEGLCWAFVAVWGLRKRRERRWIVLLAATGGLLIVGGIGFYQFWTTVREFIPLVTREELPKMIERNKLLFVTSTTEFLGLPRRWGSWAVCAFLGSLIALFRCAPRLLLLTILLYCATFVGLLGGKWVWATLPSRFVFFCLPFVLLSVSTLIVEAARLAARACPWGSNWVKFGVVAGFVAAATLIWAGTNIRRFYQRRPVENWRGAVEYIQNNAQNGDYVLIAKTSMNAVNFFRWYAKRPRFHMFSLTSQHDRRPSAKKIRTILIAGHGRTTWLFSVYDRRFRQEPQVSQLLNSRFQHMGRYGRYPVLYRSKPAESFFAQNVWAWDIRVDEKLKSGALQKIERPVWLGATGDYVVVIRSSRNVVVRQTSLDDTSIGTPSGNSNEPCLASVSLPGGSHTIGVVFHRAPRSPPGPGLLQVRFGELYTPAGNETVLRLVAERRRRNRPRILFWAVALSDRKVRAGQTLRQDVYWKFQDPSFFQPRYVSTLHSADRRFRLDNTLTDSRLYLAEDGWYVFRQTYEVTPDPRRPPNDYSIQYRLLPYSAETSAFLPNVVRFE
jgi:hypothetical protein